jgi:hypothetical protein
MAILTKIRNPLVQQLGVRRTMRAMAREAILFHCRMLE